MRRAASNHESRDNPAPRGIDGPLGSIGTVRVRELAAARELLRPDPATSAHDRILDVVAERLLLDLLSPGWRPAPAPVPAKIVVSARAPGRVAAPAAC